MAAAHEQRVERVWHFPPSLLLFAFFILLLLKLSCAFALVVVIHFLQTGVSTTLFVH